MSSNTTMANSANNKSNTAQDPKPQIPRYPPDEEAAMLADSRAIRFSSNSLFAISDYDGAMAGYERALAALPTYLEYETAVLRANMAACFVKLKEWKRVVEEADRGLDSLDDWENEKERPSIEDEDATEPPDSTASDGGPKSKERKNSDHPEPSHEDIRRIRSKLLLRRAKAGTEMGGWAALQRSLEGKHIPLHDIQHLLNRLLQTIKAR
jgi:hypothetical protein